MKRTISILVIVAMMLASVLAILPASAEEAPAGTAITSAADFAAMDAKGTYYLANDITLTATYSDAIFEGTLDGNGKTITLDGVTSAFKEIKAATISNLNLVVTYEFTQAIAAGALANYASGTFTNVVATVDYAIKDENVIASKAIGALFTEINGASTLTNCVTNGSISVLNNSTYDTWSNARYNGVAGFSGKTYNAGAVKFVNCVSNVTVYDTQKSQHVAGFIGGVEEAAQLTFENCVNNGDITGTSGNYTGIAGFVGCLSPVSSTTTTFTNCRNNGNLTELDPNGGTSKDGYLGGFVGRNYGSPKITAENCVNAGDIAALTGGWSGAGGFVGNGMTHGYDWTTYDPGIYTFKNCINLGDITGTSSFAGGIGGAFKQHSVNGCTVQMENCANFGDIEAIEYAGGMLGQVGDYGCDIVILKNCYNAGDITAPNGAAGMAGYIQHGAGDSPITNRSPMVIDNCANVGTITCNLVLKEGETHTPNKYVAAGILARFGDETNGAVVDITISNCVNAGALLNANFPTDVAQITPEYKKADYKCNDTNISYADYADGVNKFVKTADEATVNAKVDAIAAEVPGDYNELEALVNTVKNFNAADYVEGWDAFAAALANATEAVNNPCNYSQVELDALNDALNAAVEGLVALNATDTTALKAAIASAEQCQKDKYTAASVAAMEKALAEAKSALLSANQDVVDAAAAALNAALTGLVERADFTAIDAIIAECAGLTETAYTSSSWSALVGAIAAAEELKNNTNAIKADADAALAAITAAKNGLVERVATTDLAAKVADVNANYNKDNYTARSYSELRIALQAAEKYIKSGDVSADEVAATIAAIDAAIANLLEIGNFDEIDAIVDTVDKYEEKNFTPESWTAFDAALEAIENAKKPNSKGNISTGDIATLKAALEAAVAGLVAYADFTELDALIASANALVEADYTAESWAAVQNAIKAANDLKAKAGATAPEAKAALDTLQAAIDSLVKPAAPTEPTTEPENDGCGGVIGVTAVVITAVLGLGAVALKKREN